MLFRVHKPDLDQRFAELRRAMDEEIARACRELIDEFAQGIARMRAASNEAEWRAAVMESGRAFADDARALDLIGTFAALTAPRTGASRPPAMATSLGARRFARVKVAEMQLYHSAAVEAGRAAGDLYGSLQPQIDAAREAFRERFLTPGGEMADYLHAELVRELANDDAKLLGPNYPGPQA